MITYIDKGNIFELPGIYNYAHGCNCAGAMGKGIALEFKKRYPQMYIEYKNKCKEGFFSPGDIFVYDNGPGFIFNLATQISWKQKADIKNIEKSLIKMLCFASQNNISKIALPRIGAGLGGLDWEDVKEKINEVSNEYSNIDLLIVESFARMTEEVVLIKQPLLF